MIGSFLNVLIYRLPSEENWISKRSACRMCGIRIPLYRNIPLLSFIIQRGKCHNCGGKINYQYPLVELIIGLSAILLIPKNFTADGILNYFFLISVLS